MSGTHPDATVKMIHIDKAMVFTGHATRRAFRAWFRRALKRNPGINVPCRRCYVAEDAVMLLNATDTQLPQLTQPAPRPRAPKTQATPGGVVLPLTRRA